MVDFDAGRHAREAFGRLGESENRAADNPSGQ
jgi:hypothetical protein